MDARKTAQETTEALATHGAWSAEFARAAAEHLRAERERKPYAPKGEK